MRTIEDVHNELEAFTGKKTTKAYRMLKEELKSLREAKNSTEEDATESRGLGDITKDVIASVGLDKLVEPDCQACKDRQSKLNDWGDKVKNNLTRLFRGRKVKEMTDIDYQYLSEFLKDGIPPSITSLQQRRVNQIYQNVSGITKRQTTCAPCVVQVVKALEVMFNQYKKQ